VAGEPPAEAKFQVMVPPLLLHEVPQPSGAGMLEAVSPTMTAVDGSGLFEQSGAYPVGTPGSPGLAAPTL
jgi:hypothetical protein